MISLISHFQKRVLVAFTVMTLATGAALAADKINVLVWDEQQPVPKKLYPNFPGNYIAAVSYTHLTLPTICSV